MLVSYVKASHTVCSSASGESSVHFVHQNAVCVFHIGGTPSSTGRPFPGVPVNSLLLAGISLVGSVVSSMLRMEDEGERGVKLLVGKY